MRGLAFPEGPTLAFREATMPGLSLPEALLPGMEIRRAPLRIVPYCSRGRSQDRGVRTLR